MQQQAPTKVPMPAPIDAASPGQATAGLSRQAFRDMLVAAERVNRHHQGQKAKLRPS
jgi:hypothetical protein